MIVAHYCKYLNHHQIGVADEFYRALGNDYYFVVTSYRDKSQLKGGEDYSRTRKYCILAAENMDMYKKALELAAQADVCIFGSNDVEYIRARTKGDKYLTFEVSERWMKRGWLNLLSPVLLKNLWLYWTYFRKLSSYKLCQSAFAAADQHKLYTYKNRCFKWAYFTATDEEYSKRMWNPSEPVRLLWVARFIKWKHPELVVELCNRLKQNSYVFHLDFVGEGDCMDDIKTRVAQYHLQDSVVFHGNIPQHSVREIMRTSDIFLFTSDQREGWGAVANESMTSGCVIVASDAVGSTPYLVKDGVNGMVFNNMDVDSLYEKVRYLIDNPSQRFKMSYQAYMDMKHLWNAKTAVQNFLQLVDDLESGRACSIMEGPCSRA